MGLQEIEKPLCSQQNNQQREETASRTRENIASYSSIIELVFRVCTEFQKLNTKEASHSFNELAIELNRQSLKKKKWPKISGQSVHIYHGNGNENCLEVHLTLVRISQNG